MLSFEARWLDKHRLNQRSSQFLRSKVVNAPLVKWLLLLVKNIVIAVEWLVVLAVEVGMAPYLAEGLKSRPQFVPFGLHCLEKCLGWNHQQQF